MTNAASPDSSSIRLDGLRPLSDVRDVSAYLHLSLSTVRLLIREGRLPVVRVGRRLLLERETVLAFVRAHSSERAS